MIRIEGLRKSFGRGDKRVLAVDGIDLRAMPGRVFGLLGPNGAGKTTTLRAIATLLSPDEGLIEVAGHDTAREPDAVRARLGFLTGATGLYDRLSPAETLQYFGRLQGMSEERIARRTRELAQLLDMDEFLHRRVGKCSTGQKQKCSIARATLHEPEVIVLDEPTSGLDVIASASVVGFIRRCAEEGRTVLFSTHILPEAERLCHDLAFIHKGRIVEDGTLDEITARHGTRDLNSIFLKVTGHDGQA
ncbi:MAG: ATP-binding cassette domain-containing protein [bacterium]|jgi:sodium transport system ATP-binding protein|nr:ATP-binding cassette domain-containing protein [bacterium]